MGAERCVLRAFLHVFARMRMRQRDGREQQVGRLLAVCQSIDRRSVVAAPPRWPSVYRSAILIHFANNKLTCRKRAEGLHTHTHTHTHTQHTHTGRGLSGSCGHLVQRCDDNWAQPDSDEINRDDIDWVSPAEDTVEYPVEDASRLLTCLCRANCSCTRDFHDRKAHCTIYVLTMPLNPVSGSVGLF